MPLILGTFAAGIFGWDTCELAKKCLGEESADVQPLLTVVVHHTQHEPQMAHVAFHGRQVACLA